jgi:superfamily II DNA or RNA helicase
MTTPRDVRALIAHTWLSHRPSLATQSSPTHLGTITLHPHQRTAADRLLQMITADRGALLADPTGLGKTYIALAVAAAFARHTTIIAPANLRAMWQSALARTAINAAIHSIEALSRGTPPTPLPTDLLIVDEAHHFRNPSTHRYAALASLTTHTPVLLLTATPVHNDRHDLRTLLALFLGSHATTADESTLARYTVRRDHPHDSRTSTIPTVAPPKWLTLPDDAPTLRAIETLPPPVPPSDGAAAGALVTHALVRQWASSHGALRAALTRRLERAAALESALTHNRHPTYRDLHAWCLGDGAVQLAFPELLIPPASTPAAPLLAAVRAHAHALRTLVTHLDTRPDADHHRANRILEVLANHPGQPVVAFSAYEDTVRALARRLAHNTRVCALAARAGYIAGGTITRRQAIARFAPAANSAPPPPRALRIDLLITTDLLSEGVNLQDAAAVIHLDLPWTPARLEQRVGRVARLHSPHQHIAVYAIAPPASCESLLGLDRRLRHKLREAGRTLGLAGSILPSPLTPISTATAPSTAPPAATIRATLERWLSAGRPEHERERSEAIGDRPRPSGTAGADSRPIPTAAISAPHLGFIAACRIGPTPYVVAALDGAPPTDAPAMIARAMSLADTPHLSARDAAACSADTSALRAVARARDHAIAALTTWTHHRQAHHDAGLSDTPHITTATRVRMLRRIAATVRRAPTHHRPAIAALAIRARRAIAPCSAGAERVLEDLVGATVDDVTWLTTLATFADRHAPLPPQTDTAIIAVLLLLPNPARTPRPAVPPRPPLPHRPPDSRFPIPESRVPSPESRVPIPPSAAPSSPHADARGVTRSARAS